MKLDLVIRGGTVATASGSFLADVGIVGEQIAAIARGLPAGRNEIDAGGLLVLPGGVDSHCHIEQLTASGLMNADTFATATAFGGVRGHHHGDPVRRPACRHELDPGGRGLSRGGPSVVRWSTMPFT